MASFGTFSMRISRRERRCANCQDIILPDLWYCLFMGRTRNGGYINTVLHPDCLLVYCWSSILDKRKKQRRPLRSGDSLGSNVARKRLLAKRNYLLRKVLRTTDPELLRQYRKDYFAVMAAISAEGGQFQPSQVTRRSTEERELLREKLSL